MSVKAMQPRRLEELEREFADLASELAETPETKALSLLHGIVLEMWRRLDRDRLADPRLAAAHKDVESLWKTASATPSEALPEPLAPGTKAPQFTLPDANGDPVSLSDFRGKTVVLAFDPLDWRPGSSLQLDLYQQQLDEFGRRGAELVAITANSVYTHAAWTAARGLTIPLLSDVNPKGKIARAYRVWRDHAGVSERALYVIDAHGVIVYSHIPAHPHHFPDLGDLLDAVELAQTVTA